MEWRVRGRCEEGRLETWGDEGEEGDSERTENQYEQTKRNMMEMASGEGRKAGNRVRKRRRASRTENIRQGGTFRKPPGV